jgi:adenine-specific DNA-methyltransferase
MNLKTRRDRREVVAGLNSARLMARAWSSHVPERQRQQAAWAFVKAAIDAYVELRSQAAGIRFNVSQPSIALTYQLDATTVELARAVGREVAELPIEQASYQLSTTYTAMVPPALRSELGMFYTPPALTDRLLDLAEEQGIKWQSARVLDPACGGGAFLLPVAMRIRRAMAGKSQAQQLKVISTNLCGFEIDPFAAWLTQAWLEIGLADLLASTGQKLPPIVKVCDTLNQQPRGILFDLVIGNPPYGRLSLNPEQRKHFKRSLYGHANLYGVFTDIALRWACPSGVIAYLTPTSFLAGEYFKCLRSLLAEEAAPVAIDFIDARKGVFEDVLQETMLAIYRRSGKPTRTSVHYFEVSSDTTGQITHAGHFKLPKDPSNPWLAPRVPRHQALVDRLEQMKHRLADWGYGVSTGPLVWNRHKPQLRKTKAKDTLPLVWAEAIAAPGVFIHRAQKRNHEPYFKIEQGDDWLKVETPCVLVQRTTAKEQARRLIAAEMPRSFIEQHGAVVVENHLNMVRPLGKKKPKISPAAVAAVLNSSVVDDAFRCISGSVAVSAFELEALPLPSPTKMAKVEKLIAAGATKEQIENCVRVIYLGEAV